jgi:glutathione S-transferase
MKLYTLPGACSTADHIALHWSGRPFTVEIVTRDGAKAAEVRALNPSGSVPVLVDGDFVLTQNAAILGYIADTSPQARLLGDGSPRQRAEATRWLMFSNADVQPVFGTFFAPGLFMDDAAQHDALQVRARRRLHAWFERADAQLSGRDWLAGFRSVADAHFYIMLRWAAMFHFDMSGLGRLVAYRQRMEADIGVQAALAAEGLV